VGREYAPVPGKWYENREEEETFRVLSVDEDEELVEIEYVDGEIEELDLDTWHELDLEPTETPEGWSDDADADEDDDEDEDFDDEDEEDDDDDDDDDLDDEDEEEEQY
jgi:hypothetical protein